MFINELTYECGNIKIIFSFVPLVYFVAHGSHISKNAVCHFQENAHVANIANLQILQIFFLICIKKIIAIK